MVISWLYLYLVIIEKENIIMYLQQLKETSGVEITHWFENTFFISNNVTKRGIIDVGDGGKVERVSLEYFSNYIGAVEIVKWVPNSNSEIEEYFTKYLAMVIAMDHDIESDPNKIEAMKTLLNLHGTLFIENDTTVFKFKDLGTIAPFEDNSWYVCPDGADNVLCKTLAEAAKVMAEYKAKLEEKPVLFKNII